MTASGSAPVEIQSAALQIPVRQQVVASAEIDKRVLSVRGRLLYQSRALAWVQRHPAAQHPGLPQSRRFRKDHGKIRNVA